GRPLVVGADGDPRRPGTCVRDTSRAPHQPLSVARSRPSGGLAGPYLRSQPPIRSTFKIASRRRPSKSRVRTSYGYLPSTSRIIFRIAPFHVPRNDGVAGGIQRQAVSCI